MKQITEAIQARYPELIVSIADMQKSQIPCSLSFIVNLGTVDNKIKYCDILIWSNSLPSIQAIMQEIDETIKQYDKRIHLYKTCKIKTN